MRAKPRARSASPTSSTPSDGVPPTPRRRGRPRIDKASVDGAKTRAWRRLENDTSSSSWSARAVGLPGRPVRLDGACATTCSRDSREATETARDAPEVSRAAAMAFPSSAKKRVVGARYHDARTFVLMNDALAMRGDDEACLEREIAEDARAAHEFVDYADEEIRFMCAWNETARRFACAGEHESDDLCVAFARTHAREMRDKVFFDQFLRTVLAMYEFGCMDREQCVRAMRATRASGRRRAEACRRPTTTTTTTTSET